MTAQEGERFSLADIALPKGMKEWVTCAGGEDQNESRHFGPEGGALGLREGHTLVITPGALEEERDFEFIARSDSGILVEVRMPQTLKLKKNGAILRLSWANRPGCDVKRGAKIVRISKARGVALQAYDSKIDRRTKTIVSRRAITEFSLFAIAR